MSNGFGHGTLPWTPFCSVLIPLSSSDISSGKWGLKCFRCCSCVILVILAGRTLLRRVTMFSPVVNNGSPSNSKPLESQSLWKNFFYLFSEWVLLLICSGIYLIWSITYPLKRFFLVYFRALYIPKSHFSLESKHFLRVPNVTLQVMLIYYRESIVTIK